MENKSKLTGKPLNIFDLNLAIYGKMDPDAIDISPEEMKKLWPAAIPTIRSSKPIGKIIITSTSGSKSSSYFKQLFENEKDTNL